MSTKIHVAYRLRKSSDLWPFVRDCYAKGEAAAADVLRHLLGSASRDTIVAKYRGQAGSPYRSEWNFDVAIAVREHRGRLYAIPHCDMRMADVCEFLRTDPRLENFAYWNNSDRPKDVTPQAWGRRAAVWNGMIRTGWGHCLTITICDTDRIAMLLWEAEKKS